MPDLENKLVAIFKASFPGLTDESARRATREAVSNWDSVSTVMLASLIDEEFGEVFDDAGEWTSFPEVLAALEQRLNA